MVIIVKKTQAIRSYSGKILLSAQIWTRTPHIFASMQILTRWWLEHIHVIPMKVFCIWSPTDDYSLNLLMRFSLSHLWKNVPNAYSIQIHIGDYITIHAKVSYNVGNANDDIRSFYVYQHWWVGIEKHTGAYNFSKSPMHILLSAPLYIVIATTTLSFMKFLFPLLK